MNGEEYRDVKLSTITPINRYHSIAAQPLSHYFIFYDRKGKASAACGHTALVSSLLEDNPLTTCPKCALVLLVLRKES